MTDQEMTDYLTDLMRRRLKTATEGAEIPPDTPTDGMRGLFVFALINYRSAGTLNDQQLAAGLVRVRTADDEEVAELLALLKAMDDERTAFLQQDWAERRQRYEHEREQWSNVRLN